MRNKGVTLFIVLFVIAVYMYVKYVHGWLNFRMNSDTPEMYISYNIPEKRNYNSDSIEILQGLKEQLLKHDEFFQSPAYFDSTEIIIDTIVYSSAFNKLAILIITKNPSYRNIGVGKYKWYFDATCYLGVRKHDDIELSWIGPNFTNSPNKQDISKILRRATFRMLATRDSTDGRQYNINDKRFWTSSIWDKIEEKKIRKAEFEIEKKAHPENVYDPRDHR